MPSMVRVIADAEKVDRLARWLEARPRRLVPEPAYANGPRAHTAIRIIVVGGIVGEDYAAPAMY
jgi:hypothetical protein